MKLRLVLLMILVVGASPVFGAPFIVGDAANTGIGTWTLIDCPATSIVCSAASEGSPAPVYETTGWPLPPGGTWLANTATSQWISPSETFSIGVLPGAPGLYTYRMTFDLTGFVPGTASLSFQAAADDWLADVLINGASTVVGPEYFIGFDAFHGPFSIDSGFIPGVNTLDFIVGNVDVGPTPTGLRVEFLSAEADEASEIPEPATMGLMGLGLVGLAAFGRRRRSNA